MKKIKSKSGRKAASKPMTTKVKAPPTPKQEAQQVTWLLKGNLKNAQLAYIRVGKLLARVRDRNLFAALDHVDIEDYAEKRLQLGRTSLYQYLKVYDWISVNHPEWLQPKPEGFIPDLHDVGDLIWIENELARKNLVPARQTGLQELREKALTGKLSQRAVDKVRRRGLTTKDSLKAFTSKLRLLRMRGSQQAAMPAEVISHLDAAIEILKNACTLKLARLDFLENSDTDRRFIC